MCDKYVHKKLWLPAGGTAQGKEHQGRLPKAVGLLDEQRSQRSGLRTLRGALLEICEQMPECADEAWMECMPFTCQGGFAEYSIQQLLTGVRGIEVFVPCPE